MPERFFGVVKKNIFFLGSGSTQIDSSTSQAIQNSCKISMTKNLVSPDKTVETMLAAIKFENVNGKNTTNIWPKHGYFKQQPCDFGLDKENFPQNSLIYINRGYLTIKDNRKPFYADYYLIGQVNECVNPPEDIENQVCEEREVKLYLPRYVVVTGKFLGLYERLGYIVVRGAQRSTSWVMGSVNRTQKFYILIIRKGYLVPLAEHFLIAIKCCLKQAVYRIYFQIFFIVCPQQRTGAKK